MSRGELSAGDVAPYVDLLTSPVFRWSQTESDDETEGLWLQLCSTILEGIPEETQELLRAADPPRHALPMSDFSAESQANVEHLLTMLRVAQRYWGVGVTAGINLAEIGSWAGNLDIASTISALSCLKNLIRKRRPALESELFRHATKQAARRIESWLGSISSSGADVLVKRYGLRGQPSATLAEIGQSRGVSRARVQQIESRALRRLGPEVADEIRTASRAGSRPDALDRKFHPLPTRPGRDVHRTDDLLDQASLDEAWWPCGIAMLFKDLNGSTARSDRHFVKEWVKQRDDAVWLDTGGNFMKRRSENKSPYMNVARKLLAIHEAVPIGVVHEAVIDTWRSELWGKCMLSVDWLGAFLRSSTLTTRGDCLVRNGPRDYLNELNQSERQLLAALQELGGVGALDELRERLPGLRQHGSTLSQTLYNRTPVIQHVGPSIFGIRGAVHDPERVAILEDRALERGHPWLSRGGWKQEARRSLQYCIPSGNSLPTRIRLPNDIADALLGDDERLGALTWRTPDGLVHSVGFHVASAGTYLTSVRPVLDWVHASGGDTIRVTVSPDDVWDVALTEEAPFESIVIRMGRGWTSVAL